MVLFAAGQFSHYATTMIQPKILFEIQCVLLLSSKIHNRERRYFIQQIVLVEREL